MVGIGRLWSDDGSKTGYVLILQRSAPAELPQRMPREHAVVVTINRPCEVARTHRTGRFPEVDDRKNREYVRLNRHTTGVLDRSVRSR
jgi:hypothetical protein